MNELISHGQVVALEIAEVNPLLDKAGNQAAEIAFEILEQGTEKLHMSAT